jgi:ABC-type lipoprotein export system ATPase subunit
MSGPLSGRAFGELGRELPPIRDFFTTQGLPSPGPDQTPEAYFAGLDPQWLEEAATTREDLADRFARFVEAVSRCEAGALSLESLTVRGGRDKAGRPETLDLTLVPGEVVALVGPTGSGKSRFLADIEWLANGDTPTGRRVLLSGRACDAATRLSASGRLVAQLSQNMNFVMDLPVGQFLRAHAASRLLREAEAAAEEVVALANELAGEPFSPGTPLTALSGGQSRALMIADVARLCASPVVLVDEIENAGVDRRRAISLLTGSGKIVLMATHDPMLALLAGRRLVFAGGAVAAVIETSPAERETLAGLTAMDARVSQAREALRLGRRVALTG